LKATSDLESESEKEVNTANMCFMANDNTPKVAPRLQDIGNGSTLIAVAQDI